MTKMELENEYAALLAYAYRVCADEREAEELVSDTMLSVLDWAKRQLSLGCQTSNSFFSISGSTVP